MTAVSKPRVHRSLGCAFLILGLFVACAPTDATAERLCTPGAYVYCRCQNRDPGTKLCKKTGQEFEECLPCDGSGNPGTGSGGEDGIGGRMEGSGDDDDPDKTREETLEPDSGAPDPPTPSEEEDGGSSDSDSGTGTTSTRDGGKPPASKPPVSKPPQPTVDAPHCQPLSLDKAPKIEVQKVADVPAAPKGGKPKDGVYLQSWVVEFTGPDGESGPSKHYSREKLEIRGNYARYTFEDDDGQVASGGMRLTLNDKKVTVEYECPAARPRDLAFDAINTTTSSTLVVYDPPYARVFVKQKETSQ